MTATSSLGFFPDTVHSTSTPLLCPSCLSKFTSASHGLDPGLKQLLYSHKPFNFSVSLGEVSRINAFLEETPHRLAMLNQSISELEHSLAALKNARQDLEQHSVNAQSIISAPIRKLPAELLDEIFAFYCFSQEGGYTLSWWDDAASVHLSCPPLKLSHVCSSWRKYLQSRPVFWSSLRFSSRGFRLNPGTFEILIKYLEYSRDHPLDLYYVEEDDFWPSPKVEEAVAILLDNSTRWRRATLSASEYSAEKWFVYATTMLKSLSSSDTSRIHLGHCPALEYLEIPAHLPWSEGIIDFLQTLSICPRLKTYYGSSFSWSGHDLDFSQITELSLTSFTGKSIGHLLRPLPALKSLALGSFIYAEDDVDDTWIQETGYHTSGLSELIVSTRTFYPDAWRFLRLPNLTELRVLGTGAVKFENFVHLSSMLLDSQCELRTLKLQFFVFIQKPMLDFIELFPSTQNLTVSFRNLDDIYMLVRGLKRNGDGSCLAPNLCSLTLAGRGHLADVQSFCDGICDVVVSRRTTITTPSTSGLQKLSLNLNLDHASACYLSNSLPTQLAPFIEEGLAFNISAAC
ncbi:hypothetical protein GYMLUDRAFT_101222 [Collybiopsis luxurians FD-317 M1]|uniref:F-box domain-containing protein n=1 Tax=Collybiopsis luxurians FD-317 M1 TaxID=944289 RepID=A0A0D0BMQ8_9AGAR|nr:hypothetical protein GYMLUDRAFT_101222 [Collybiopsis luxurians FD-317 M1]